jgi:hypothetical protein
MMLTVRLDCIYVLDPSKENRQYKSLGFNRAEPDGCE